LKESAFAGLSSHGVITTVRESKFWMKMPDINGGESIDVYEEIGERITMSQ
jgi:predicted DNA-binding ribbon-helix-helix protein